MPPYCDGHIMHHLLIILRATPFLLLASCAAHRGCAAAAPTIATSQRGLFGRRAATATLRRSRRLHTFVAHCCYRACQCLDRRMFSL
jgi:hypothetical protein